MGVESQLFELFFVARVQQGGAGSGQAVGHSGSIATCNGSSGDANGSNGSSSSSEVSSRGGSQQQRSALFCKFLPPGAGTLPPEDNLSAFCWPLGVQAVKPSAYLVTAEFTFTLTGGDGTRLHGVCRRTHDPTYRPLPGGPGPRGGGGSVVEHKRLPQVICILSQHCWQPFFSKVLEIADQLLAPHAGLAQLPPDAPAALFLASLPRLLVAAGPPLPPLGAVLRVPLPYSAAPISVERMRRALAPPGAPASAMLLGLSADAIELEVPPELGNGATNAGVSLARLLWFLTPRQAVTLVASLLLERRIILVARDAETVSAAVHAASALLYPFRWQHIYLPLLPLALKDYLAAPMPYLVGIQSDCLPLLRGMALEETVMVDLDRLGNCTPELGSPGDDYFQLPFARELEDVFEVVREHIQSPTEFDSTPKCTELLQDFFLRLVGGYRKFVRPDEEVTPAALALGLDRPLAAANSGAHASAGNGKGGSKVGPAEDENPRAHGFVFDQAAFILAHRRKDKVAAFLQQFRNSQMLEVFITERLKLASEGYITDDPFELKVAERNTRLGMRLGIPGVGSVAVPAMAAAAAGKGRIGSLLRKGVSAVKQGGAGLAASIKQLGTSQQEADLALAWRTHSGPNLGRISPSAHGLGLARRSPVPAAASLVAHSRGNSFSGSSRPSSRSGSFSNLPHLARPSANLAALNGGVQPSLEQLRPDMFFGADDAEDDDASSVTSRTSQETGWAGTARASGGHAAGPLAAAFNARRSFGTLFHATTSVSSSVALPTQSPSASALGSRAASMQHVASRLGTATTESHEQLVLQQGAAEQPFGVPAGGGMLAAGAAGASVGGVLAAGLLAAGLGGRTEASSRRPSAVAAGPAASPGSLFDLASPAPQPQPKLGHPPLPRPQQLFGDAGREGAEAQPPSSGGQRTAPSSVHSRSSSLGGWATFEDAYDPAGAPFGSPQAAHGAPGSSFLELEEGVGPLGSGMSRSVVRQLSHSSSAAAAVALAAAPALASSAAAGSAGLQQHHQQQQPPPPQQEYCGYFSQQPVAWQGWQEQQHAEQQPPTPCWQQQREQLPASPYEQPPAWACQSSGAAAQSWAQSDPRQEGSFIPQQQQQQHEGLLAAAPKQPPTVHDGVSAGWMPYDQQPAAGGAAGCRAPPAVALPAVCRMSAHSPLAAGIASVQRITSVSHLGAPPDMRRTSSSSCCGGAGSGVSWSGSGSASGAASPPRQAPAAGQALFADLAQQAVADACERAPARHRTSSSCAGPADLYHSPLRLSSTSSWAEFAEAPAPGYTGNPFEQPPTLPWPAAHQQAQPQHQSNPTPPLQHHQPPPQFQEQGQLRRIAARTSSGFGDFAGGGVLASQLSSLQLT